MYRRLIAVAVSFAFLFSFMYMRIYVIMCNDDYKESGIAQGTCKLTVGNINGNIYDRNFQLLVNSDTKYYAAINPTCLLYTSPSPRDKA